MAKSSGVSIPLKYLETHAWAKSVDQDQTLSALFATPQHILAHHLGSQMVFFYIRISII